MPTACARTTPATSPTASAPASTGEKLAAAEKFLAYITSPEAMQIWLKTVGELPARKPAALTDENLADPIYAPFLKGLEYAHTTLFVDEAAQRQNAIDMVNRVLLEGQDPQGLARAGRHRRAGRSSTTPSSQPRWPDSRSTTRGAAGSGRALAPPDASHQKQVVWAWAFLALPIVFYVRHPLLSDAARPSGCRSPTGTCCGRQSSSASPTTRSSWHDPMFWKVFRNTFTYLIIGTPVSLFSPSPSPITSTGCASCTASSARSISCRS